MGGVEVFEVLLEVISTGEGGVGGGDGVDEGSPVSGVAEDEEACLHTEVDKLFPLPGPEVFPLLPGLVTRGFAVVSILRLIRVARGGGGCGRGGGVEVELSDVARRELKRF